MADIIEAFNDVKNLITNYSRTYEYESLECAGETSFYNTQAYFLIPAFAISVFFMFTIRRKNMGLDKVGGRPGIVYPMNILTRSERMAYAACFGVISNLVLKIIFDGKQAIEYTGPIYGKPFVTVLSCLIYGVNCFPLFASVALRTVISCVIGTLYTWSFGAVAAWTFFQCEMTTDARLAYFLMNGCQLISLGYLSLRLPYGVLVTLGVWRETGQCGKVKVTKSLWKLRQSYQGQHVGMLATKINKEHPPEGCAQKVGYYLKRFCKNWVYDWQPDFKYSARFLAIMWIGFTVLYMAAWTSIWNCMSAFLYATNFADYILDSIGWDDQPGETDTRKTARILMKIWYFGLAAFLVLAVFCLILAFIIGVLAILYSLMAYRTNMRALQRGDHSIILPRTHKKLSNISIVTGSIRYAGYQVGYIAWAFAIQTLCVFIIAIIIIILVLVIVLGISNFHMKLLEYFGPWVVILIAVMICQHLAVKLIFLEDYRQSLAIDNRRCLFLTSYFLFFYNVFIGLGACLLRLTKSLFLGICLISRLDQSLLNRKHELKDTGYQRYLGFIHLENYHNHPVQHVMVSLLQISAQATREHFLSGESPKVTSRRGNKIGADVTVQHPAIELAPMPSGERIEGVEKSRDIEAGHASGLEANNDSLLSQWENIKASPKMKLYRKHQKSCFTWSLIYTLHNNPQLCLLRKGYIQQRMQKLNQGETITGQREVITGETIARAECTDLDLEKTKLDREISVILKHRF